jgi:hypothetical protein
MARAARGDQRRHPGDGTSGEKQSRCISVRRFFCLTNRVRALVTRGVSPMPRPFRGQITRKSTVHELIRADKSQYIRAPVRQIRPGGVLPAAAAMAAGEWKTGVLRSAGRIS